MSIGKKIALGISGLVLLAVLFLVVEHFRGKIALRNWKARMEARGEALGIERLTPEPVPIEKNGMPALIWSASQTRGFPADYQPPSPRYVAPGKVLAITQVEGWTNRTGRSQVTNITWKVVADALAQHEAALEGTLEALEAECLQARFDYSGGFSIPLPHLATLKSAAQVLCASALLDLHRGDADAATRKLVLTLRLVKDSQDERLIISQLVRIAIASIAFNATWQAAQTEVMSDVHLARLQKAWTELEFLVAMENALAMEGAMASMELENFRNSGRGFEDLWDPGNVRRAPTGPGFVLSVNWFLNAFEQTPELIRDEVCAPIWKFAWSRQDELNYWRVVHSALELNRRGRQAKTMPRAPSASGEAADELFQLIDHTRRPDNLYDRIRFVCSSMIISAHDKSIRRAWIAETVKSLAVAGIALKRYDQKHRQAAPSLDALAPDFLGELPWDPMDGKPFKYQLVGGKGRLYSVGEDGVDDAGDVTPAKPTRTFNLQNSRDWVWPEPASAEEIEAYYQRAGR